jgi:hypothetical protein
LIQLTVFYNKDKNETKGGFHKAVNTLRLKFALCAHLFSLINNYVLAHYAQLIAFSPRFVYTLCFTRTPKVYEIHPKSIFKKSVEYLDTHFRGQFYNLTFDKLKMIGRNSKDCIAKVVYQTHTILKLF